MPRLLLLMILFVFVVMMVMNVRMMGIIFENVSIERVYNAGETGGEGQLLPVETTMMGYSKSGGVMGILPRSKTKQKLRNLVVFCSLGTRSAIPIVQYNLNAHFRTNRSKNSSKDHDDMYWDCIVFLYVNEQSLGSDLLEDLAQSCTITRLPGLRWVHFLMTLSPTLVQDYDYIAVVLDDLLAPALGPSAVNVPRLIHHMQTYNISSISPTVHGGNWASNSPVALEGQENRCVRQVRLVETYFQLFTTEMWTNCLYPLFHFDNPMAYCVDICVASVCPSRLLAVDESMEMYHVGKEGKNVSIPSDVLQMIALSSSASLKESLLSETPLERGQSKFLVQRRSIKKNDALCKKFGCKGARTKEEADWINENPFYCTHRRTANST